ncbi:Arm DNA-binding domain-containing protein [Dyella nitratireducens]|uniref:Arm DNA-binding domain-containing protein n=1 Tax=Dyella nitratireducens TaxID=1849580 RepID=UPI003CCD8626
MPYRPTPSNPIPPFLGVVPGVVGAKQDNECSTTPSQRGLTEVLVDDAVARAEPFKLFDRSGLFPLTTPHGAKYRRQKFHLLGKKRQCSLRVYPEILLSEACTARDRDRAQVAMGLDPVEVRRQSREGSAPPNFLAAHDFQ